MWIYLLLNQIRCGITRANSYCYCEPRCDVVDTHLCIHSARYRSRCMHTLRHACTHVRRSLANRMRFAVATQHRGCRVSWYGYSDQRIPQPIRAHLASLTRAHQLNYAVDTRVVQGMFCQVGASSTTPGCSIQHVKGREWDTILTKRVLLPTLSHPPTYPTRAVYVEFMFEQCNAGGNIVVGVYDGGARMAPWRARREARGEINGGAYICMGVVAGHSQHQHRRLVHTNHNESALTPTPASAFTHTNAVLCAGVGVVVLNVWCWCSWPCESTWSAPNLTRSHWGHLLMWHLQHKHNTPDTTQHEQHEL